MELLFIGYSVSVGEDEKVLEIADDHSQQLGTHNITDCTLKNVKIFVYVYFCTI